MDFAAENFIEANKIKAESKGKSLDQLLAANEADVSTPFKIAAVASLIKVSKTKAVFLFLLCLIFIFLLR